MRRLTLVFAILAMLATALPAAADDGERDEGGRVFGPYASGSPDSGTCGNWANDTFKRFFKVTPNADGSFTLREDFRDGHFVTLAGASPAACETVSPSPHGTTIRAGVRGEFHGFLAGRVTGGTFTAAGGCPAPCSTAGFLATHFGASATWDPSFRFRYEADGHGLQFRRWQNASADQGGNRGDIAD